MRFRVLDIIRLTTCLALAGVAGVQYDRANNLAAELKRANDRRGVEITNAIVARDKIWWNLLDEDCQEKGAAAWNFGMPGN